MSIIEKFVITVFQGNPLIMEFLGGGIITLLNAVGAIPVFFLRKLNQALNDVALGFAAGVMFFSKLHELNNPRHRSCRHIACSYWNPNWGFSNLDGRPGSASYA
ncbi:MAG: hypothetical protein QXT26_01775 [Thermoproteota archaeon]